VICLLPQHSQLGFRGRNQPHMLQYDRKQFSCTSPLTRRQHTAMRSLKQELMMLSLQRPWPPCSWRPALLSRKRPPQAQHPP
jgi:hypothetical protein